MECFVSCHIIVISICFSWAFVPLNL